MIAIEPEAVDQLLAIAGLPGIGEGSELARIDGGANNRVYSVIAGSERAVLKAYFKDDRPRLRAEFSFLELARECGVDFLARPVARDDAAGIALYEFLPGRRMTTGDVDGAAVELAASTFALINERRELAAGRELPLASEACFTVSEHLERVEQRVGLLAGLAPEDDVDELAAVFVAERLAPAWREICQRVTGEAAERQFELEQPIPAAERCVSPSDFGFHNALVDERGRISFLDFEYAGWDDPAKLVCDFFSQVAVPAPLEHQARFEAIALSPFPDPERIRSRIALLAPVYRVKWTCIVLNDFLAQGRARRSYALGTDQDEERRSEQLRKAAALLDGAA